MSNKKNFRSNSREDLRDKAGIDNENRIPSTGKGKEGKKRSGNDGRNRKRGNIGKRQDPFWYSKDAATIAQMGTIPWTEVVGTDFDRDIDGSIPAAIIYPVYHTVGNEWVEEANSLTRAANKYYQYLTQGFTGSVDFEAPDLLMTAMAACSLNALFKEGMRAFGYTNSFSGLNKYRPYAVIEALGFNPNIFNGTAGHSKADFVTDFNIRVDQFNELIALPAGMFLRDRWDFISSGLFSDNDQDEYNTIQAYVTEAYLEYDGTSALTGTSLKWYRPHNGAVNRDATANSLKEKFSYDSYFEALDHLISALTSDDCRNMFGALRRVYNDAQLYKIDYLSPDFTEKVVRNDIISVELHNAECWDYVFPDYSEESVGTIANTNPLIYQTSQGQVKCSTYATLNHGDDDDTETHGNFYPGTKLLDSFAVEPTAGNVLDMIAHLNIVQDNMSTFVDHPDGDEHQRLVCWPVSGRTELLRMPWIYYYEGNSNELKRARMRVAVKHLSDIATDLLARFTHVNSATFIRTFDRVNSVTDEMYWPYIDNIYGEIDKYTMISSSVLRANFGRSTYYSVQMPKNEKSITK